VGLWALGELKITYAKPRADEDAMGIERVVDRRDEVRTRMDMAAGEWCL
jgi:hypothetical protein